MRLFLGIAGRIVRPAIGFAVILAAAAPATAQPAAPAIRAELASTRISDRELRAFYEARGFRPLWIRGGALGPEAAQLLRMLETADLDGLDPDDYRPRNIARAIDEAGDGSPRNLIAAELLLSRQLAAYARDMRRPRDTGMIYVDRELAPTAPPAREILAEAAAAPSLARYLTGAGWMHPYYGPLRAALAASRPGPVRASRIQIPPGPLLREGSRGERVALLRARLGFDPQGPFDRELAAALRAFQAAHGLPADARVGPRTLAMLNGDGADRQRVLRLNLARVRALPAGPRGRYVLVDAAAARLYLYENGRVRDTMRVVVGRVTDPTPIMAGLIRYAAVNPYWNIPPDLVPSRVAEGVLREGPAFLRARRYEILSDWSDRAVPVDPGMVDWRGVAAGRLALRVRQLPGPSNAMGRMKFMFPNELGVYLHDTPERDLLREAARQFSAGCVRVEDAPRLARWLFGRPLDVPAGGREQNVPLPDPVPVYITYLTAAPEGDAIAYRQDVYNRDSEQGRRRART